MSHASYYRLLKLYSDLWARPRCRVLMSGEENLQGNLERNRIYLVNHPTTYDLPLLVHISRTRVYVVVAEGAFAHPLVGWLFRGTGFPMLTAGNSEEVIRDSCRLIRGRNPMVYSLKGYGVDFGEEVRPRTGSIRIAHSAEADIYPVHLAVEKGKTAFKYHRDRLGGVFPYTVFADTLYFVTFCKPLRYPDYAKETMGYADYKAIACGIEDMFQAVQRGLERDMAERPEHFAGQRRRGGADRQISL